MNKTLQAAHALDTSGARAADDDPWSEFLSESSGEFQQQSEEVWAAEGEGDLSTPPAPTTQFVSPDVVPSSDASPTWVTPSVPWDPAPSRRQEQQSTEVVPFRESAHSGSTGNQISLADVIARQVPVVWSEAVATIEELCAVLINTGSPRAAVPELSDVMITPAGTVTIRHGAIGDRDLSGVSVTDSTHCSLPPTRRCRCASSSRHPFRPIDTIQWSCTPRRCLTTKRQAEPNCIQALYERTLEVRVSLRQSPESLERLYPQDSRRRASRVSKIPVWVVAVAAALVGAAAAGVLMWQTSLRTTSQSVQAAQIAGAGSAVSATAALDKSAGAKTSAVEFDRARAPRSDDWAPGSVTVRRGRRFTNDPPSPDTAVPAAIAAVPRALPLAPDPIQGGQVTRAPADTTVPPPSAITPPQPTARPTVVAGAGYPMT